MTYEKAHKVYDPLQPIGGVGKPEDVAKLVAFVTDNEQAGFITGSVFFTDGGAMIAASLKSNKNAPYP